MTHRVPKMYSSNSMEFKNDSASAGDSEVKQAIRELGSAFEQFKATNEIALKEIKKGAEDVVTKDKLDRINSALDSLSEAKAAAEARADEIEKRLNRTQLETTSEDKASVEAEVKAFNDHRRSVERYARSSDLSSEEYVAYKSAFENVIRKGDMALLSDSERKAMSVGVDPDGGYLVPASVSARIVTKVYETSPVRPLVTVETITTDALEGLADLDEADSGGWVSEMGTRSATGTPQLGKWRIPVYEMYAKPYATQQLIDDASINVEAWLANKVSDKLTRVENAAFITGTGVGQPQGFCSYTTAATADSSRTWGQIEHVLSGANGDFVSTNPADKLFDLEAAFKPAYLANATIATRRTVVQKLRKIKDGNGQYLWQPGLVAGKPQTLIGYGISLLEDMPALATNSLSLAMGDFKAAYTIVDRQGFRVIRDNLTEKPYVLFYTTRRTGGGVVNFEAIKFLKFAA